MNVAHGYLQCGMNGYYLLITNDEGYGRIIHIDESTLGMDVNIGSEIVVRYDSFYRALNCQLHGLNNSEYYYEGEKLGQFNDQLGRLYLQSVEVDADDIVGWYCDQDGGNDLGYSLVTGRLFK